MRIHFISIGGAVMHNLALELHQLGHEVTGSDDEIYDPSRTRLAKAGLLPQEMGWDENRISNNIDLILLGMHARANNPELLKAQEIGLKIQSFPEFIGGHAKNKTQIVIAGSHGKTTTTSMIMHVLKQAGVDFDYLVGAQLEGFDRMVRLSDAPYIVIEGDEYLSSAIDRRPKFIHYRPDILVLTGIQWDHMNVFPTETDYMETFVDLFDLLEDDANVFADAEDVNIKGLISKKGWPFSIDVYKSMSHQVLDGIFHISPDNIPLHIIGSHNMKNMQAAEFVCLELGISKQEIRKHFSTFLGAAKRQDVLLKTDDLIIIRDFAHAPSKVRATLKGVREMFPDRHITALCELHTYSSLNKEFLPQYAGALDPADAAVVFYSPQTLKIKKMPPIDFQEIKKSFDRNDAEIFTESESLLEYLIQQKINRSGVILIMSSGTFGGMDLNRLQEE